MVNLELNKKILKKFLTHRNGVIERSVLLDAFPNKQPQIASLCSGTRPKLKLEREAGTYTLTQTGYRFLETHNVNMSASNVTLEQLPDFIRERAPRATNNNNIENLIELELDRNEYVKLTCKVHPKFKDWVQAHGRKRNFSEYYGASTARNWDASTETEIYEVNLQNIDRYSSGSSNIVTDTAINSILIKLACASENNEYTVKYRGLVAWELVQNYGQKMGEEVTSFYKNYVHPCKLRIEVKYVF